MKRREFLKAISLLAFAPLLMAESCDGTVPLNDPSMPKWTHVDSSLIEQKPVKVTEGSFNGSAVYFLIAGGGSITGSFTTSDKLQFAWVDPDSRVSITVLPYTDIVFDIGHPTSPPTVTWSWKSSNYYDDSELVSTVMNASPNWAISKHLDHAIIHITKEQLLKEGIP